MQNLNLVLLMCRPLESVRELGFAAVNAQHAPEMIAEFALGV
jgi:hypothetical protein